MSSKVLRISVLFLFIFAIAFSFSYCKKDTDSTNNTIDNPPTTPDDGIPYGNPQGTYPIPTDAGLIDVTSADQTVGNGTPESCDCDAVVNAVAKGGKIVFNCGAKPKTILMTKTAKIFNDANKAVTIDGKGLITLDGGGKTRLLYMNTCDQNQHWTTPTCQNQDHPYFTVQNLTFINGNSKAETENTGGGAIWVRGGRFKAVNCRFFNNVCAETGPDVGGGALRVTSQYNNLPVYLTNCTFGGKDGYGNKGSNGGAISSIGVSWTIINSLFSYNQAIGNGGNPAKTGTPGGGSGGAIYNDGNTMTLKLLGTKIELNQVNAYGAGIFFVTNNHTGNIVIDKSYIKNNIGGSWYPKFKGISMHDDTKIEVTNSETEQ